MNLFTINQYNACIFLHNSQLSHDSHHKYMTTHIVIHTSQLSVSHAISTVSRHDLITHVYLQHRFQVSSGTSAPLTTVGSAQMSLSLGSNRKRALPASTSTDHASGNVGTLSLDGSACAPERDSDGGLPSVTSDAQVQVPADGSKYTSKRVATTKDGASTPATSSHVPDNPLKCEFQPCQHAPAPLTSRQLHASSSDLTRLLPTICHRWAQAAFPRTERDAAHPRAHRRRGFRALRA